MLVTAAWVALMVLAAGWELSCHRPGSRWTSLSELASRVARTRPGRLLLVAGWGFVGWHVFARYTLPR